MLVTNGPHEVFYVLVFCTFPNCGRSETDRFIYLFFKIKRPSHLTCSLLVCATIHLSPLLTPLTSQRKKTPEFLRGKKKEKVCRLSSHNGGDRKILSTGFVKKALGEEKSRE